MARPAVQTGVGLAWVSWSCGVGVLSAGHFTQPTPLTAPCGRLPTQPRLLGGTVGTMRPHGGPRAVITAVLPPLSASKL